MARVTINDDEWDAMNGLPHRRVCLYLALRRRMDFDTGMVGVAHKISYQALAEDIYVEPGRGRVDSGAPTKNELRKDVAALADSGLLRVVEADKQLIFELLKADRVEVRPKQTEHKRNTNGTHPPEHSETHTGRGFAGETEHKQNTPIYGETEHTSEIRDQEDLLSTSSDNQPLAVPSNKPPRARKTAPPVVEIPEFVPPDAWAAFEEMRKAIKKPMTNKARELIFDELFKLMQAGDSPREVLEQSVRKCWQDVYALKKPPSRASPADEKQRRDEVNASAQKKFSDFLAAEREQQQRMGGGYAGQ